MSGHSKWSTIKHKKAATDAKRGKIFTKLGKAITIAAREGGADETSNFQLRLTVEKAKLANMPKTNIQKAIDRGAGSGGEESLLEATYEGFFGGKIAIMVEVVTDNKNRTAAEIKTFFEKNGGSMGQPGSVSFLFDKKGVLLVEKDQAVDEQMLKIIDLEVEDVREELEGLMVIVASNQLMEFKQKLEELKLKVVSAELEYLAKSKVELTEQEYAKAKQFLMRLSDLDDVQQVFANIKGEDD